MHRFLSNSLISCLILVLSLEGTTWAAAPANVVLGSFEAQKAQIRLQALPQPNQAQFQNLLEQAKSPQEKGYLRKAFANGYGMKALESFASSIRGHDAEWLRNHLHLTNNSRSEGIRQIWQNTCGPTTAIACLGELDPLYAFRYHQGLIKNEQKRLQETPYPDGTYGGKPIPLGASGGNGRLVDDLINNNSKLKGLNYQSHALRGKYGMTKALNDMNTTLSQGLPVPLVVKHWNDEGLHYVLALSVRMENGQRAYAIHQPGDGKTVLRTETQLRQGKMDVDGCNTLIEISVPTVRNRPKLK